MDLENRVQYMLYKISSEISKTKSEKRLYTLYDDAAQLYTLADSMELNITLPPKISDFIDNGIEEILSDSFRRLYIKGADKSICATEDVDDMICTLGPMLYDKYNTDYIYGKSHIFKVDEAFKLAESFFAFYDKDMHKHFKKMVDGGFAYVTSSPEACHSEYVETLAITSTAYCQNSSFVLIGGKRNINFVVSIIHEIIHSYIDSYNYGMTCEERLREEFNGLYEVITYFSAHAFKNYLEEINFDKKTITFLESSICNILVESFIGFCYADDTEFSNYINMLSFAYGNLLSFHYFEKYLEDSSKVQDDILSLTLDAKEYDRKYLLNNYGLKVDEILDEKVLTKRLEKNYHY